MSAHATIEDLEAYLYAPAPIDADRLIERASDLIDSIAIGVTDYNREDLVVLAALKNATCAQVEQWVVAGEDQIITGRRKHTGMSVGDLRVDSQPNIIAPRALTYLQMAGLTQPVGL